MTREQLQEKSLNDLREIAKLQGVKSLTKYRKGELIDIIMNGGQTDKAAQPKDKDAVEEAEPVRQEPRKEKETVLEPQLLQHAAEQPTVEEVHPANAGNVYEPRTRYPQQPQYRAPRQEYQQGG